MEVFFLLAQGECWKAIAATLVISIWTVRLHSKNLLRKIGAQNPAAAVAKIFSR